MPFQSVQLGHKVTEDERSALTCGLRLAAAQYLKYSVEVLETELAVGAKQSLADQFRRQEADAKRLADLIENAGEVIFSKPEEEEETGHPFVNVGHCKVCGHYGEDCTGYKPADLETLVKNVDKALKEVARENLRRIGK